MPHRRKDFFTGLLNKRACKEYVQDSIATNKDIHYMAMIDIDNFKNVNDTYGHLYGDKVILKVAAIINSALNGRGIVGRFGGDEFFIFTNWITKESQLRSILTFIKQKVRAELGQERTAVMLLFLWVYVNIQTMEVIMTHYLIRLINAFILPRIKERTDILYMMHRNTAIFLMIWEEKDFLWHLLKR